MIEDPRLRARALAALSAYAPPLAGQALDEGLLARAPAGSWEGSAGTMHGERVVLHVAANLHAQLEESPAAVDALTAAVAAAIAEDRAVLTDLALATSPAPTRHPYR